MIWIAIVLACAAMAGKIIYRVLSDEIEYRNRWVRECDLDYFEAEREVEALLADWER